MKKELKTFEFHWLDGTVETSDGYDVADAFRRAGYGGGAISALDYVSDPCSNYQPKHPSVK